MAVCAVLLPPSDDKEKRTAAATAERRALIDDISTASAKKLEGQLKELRGNEIRTERVIHTETIKPVFSNVCATDDYVRLFNAGVDRYERALSGQSDSAMPDRAPAPGGENRE
ncbi:hypothetical protein [Edaphovirga cremea]|uniref:hypothetical protein n=1 Tax=Edaphovirga cremea TaxID=2267246 RepID=UPI003988F203